MTTCRELSAIVRDYIKINHITGKMPGIIKLSRELNVNQITLGKVFHQLVDQGLLEIRGTGGTFVRSTEEPEVHHLLGLIGLNNDHGQNTLIFNEVSKLAQQAGYHVIAISFDEALFQENPQAILNFKVDGFLFRYSSLSPQVAQILHQANIPVVSHSMRTSYPWLDFCEPDHFKGYSMLLDHLRQLGHRRIGFIEFARPVQSRYRQNMVRQLFEQKLGADFDPEIFYVNEEGNQLFLRYGQECYNIYAEAAYQKMFGNSRPPTALIGAEDLIELMVQRHALKIPQELSVLTMSYKSDHLFSGVFYDELAMYTWGIKRLLGKIRGALTLSEHRFIPPTWHDKHSTMQLQ